MSRVDDEPLEPGKGRISGTGSVFLGALSVLAVLCFHLPEYLTTPELRKSYDVALLRRSLAATMADHVRSRYSRA
jgi:hypothetical protein